MLAGYIDTGKAILRGYIRATVVFEAGSQSGLALLVQGGRRTWQVKTTIDGSGANSAAIEDWDRPAPCRLKREASWTPR